MADIANATKSISQDYRDDTKLIMQPYANWEEYLVPAPVSIAILGELVFIFSNVDFSIGQKPPEGGFKYIKYPDSFRACLMQVSTSISAAFNEALKNMEQISLHTGNMAACIKISMKVLLLDNDEIIRNLLPDHQEIIANILHKCAELTDQAENKFTIVINLIQELLVACIDAYEVYSLEKTISIMSNTANQMAKTVQKTDSSDDVAMSNVLSKAGQILELAQTLNGFIDKQQIKWSDIYDQRKGKTRTSYMEQQYTQIQTSVESEKGCKAKEDALDICTAAIELCSELTEIAPEGKCDAAMTKQIIKRMQKLLKQCQTFDSENKAFTNTPAFTPETPQQAKESGKKRAGEMAVENARFRIEQSRAQLEKARELQKQSLENLEKNQKELTEILVTLRNCEVKEIDFNTTIKILVKGLDAMGRVKEQWEKMVRFFQMISNIVQTCLSSCLTNLFKGAKYASQRNLPYDTKKYLKDLMYQQALAASNVASLVNMISGTYVEVSDKHLMDMISSLGELMALDPSRPDFESELRKLHNACDAAQDTIRDLVVMNKKKFDLKAKERMESIEKELQPMLPPVSEEKMKEIKEITDSSFKGMSKEDEDQYA